jgi:hypothetical protein
MMEPHRITEYLCQLSAVRPASTLSYRDVVKLVAQRSDDSLWLETPFYETGLK